MSAPFNPVAWIEAYDAICGGRVWSYCYASEQGEKVTPERLRLGTAHPNKRPDFLALMIELDDPEKRFAVALQLMADERFEVALGSPPAG